MCKYIFCRYLINITKAGPSQESQAANIITKGKTDKTPNEDGHSDFMEDSHSQNTNKENYEGEKINNSDKENFVEYEKISDSETSEEAPPFNRKRKWYPQKFKKDWMTRFSFIEERYDSIFCKVCHVKIVGGKCHIERHEKTNSHLRKMKAARTNVKINEILVDKPKVTLNKAVKRAELKLTALVAEHNLPFKIMDHLPALCASAFPDSTIAKNIRIKRKKCTQITVGLLGPVGKLEVIEFIKRNPFSVILDETTDVSCNKCLAVVVRFFKNGKVQDAFLDLIELDSSTSVGIYLCFKKLLDDNNIPYNNVVGVAADNANVMMGNIQSVRTLLRDNINNKIIVIGCTCHSFHLCSSHACKKLPPYLEQFIHNVCNYFSHSSKRNQVLSEFQTFANERNSRILKISSTRWLSLGMVVKRLLVHWNSLSLYFQNEVLVENEQKAQDISYNFTKITKCYLLFLSYILELVNKLVLEFQSESTKVHHLLENMTNLYKTILGSFIKKSILKVYDQNIKNLVFNDPGNFMDITEIYFGAELEVYVCEHSNSINQVELLNFKRHALDFYVELCRQIKIRFNFDNESLQFASLFDPKKVTSDSTISIAKAKVLFNGLDVDLEELNAEWRLASEVGKKYSTLDVDEFWNRIIAEKNTLDEPMFSNLAQVVNRVLALPHSSAAAERIFSQLNLIKINTRNKLAVKTVSSLLHTKELLKQNCSNLCYNFEPNNNLLNYNHSKIENTEVLNEDVILHTR